MLKMSKYAYLFTSESVSEGHPDKVADRISDSILDAWLAADPEARVACETFVTTDCVMVAGEVSSPERVDTDAIIRRSIREIGYDRPGLGFSAEDCEIITRLHAQSPDISRGVVRASALDQGAGDQGMMFGYACRDAEEYMPLALSLSHKTMQLLAGIRHNEPGLMPYLRPDAKTQFTVEFSDRHEPLRVHTIVLSTQHDEFSADDEEMHSRIEADVRSIVLPRLIASLPSREASLFDDKFILHVNPTGKFVIGGPAGDTGLTGRKIIVDTYGGRGAHGGGAFSGKDPSKVDRSAAYAARHIAKNLVASGLCDECLVELAYAIGVAEPVSVFVDTFGTGLASGTHRAVGGSDQALANLVRDKWDLRPAAIIERFALKNPIYTPTSSYGHFGRKSYAAPMRTQRDGLWAERELTFFPWEKLDAAL